MKTARTQREVLGSDELDILSAIHKYRDGKTQRDVVRIGAGACYVSDGSDILLTTVLGSCISVCAYDPVTGIGGMNHFMLPMPAVSQAAPNTIDLRTGAHAMEALLNQILSLGCTRDRIQVKIFGGADLMGTTRPVGAMNIKFTMDYFAREGMPISASDVGGTDARKLEFAPQTGKARVRLIVDDNAQTVRMEETKYQKQMRSVVPSRDVELF